MATQEYSWYADDVPAYVIVPAPVVIWYPARNRAEIPDRLVFRAGSFTHGDDGPASV